MRYAIIAVTFVLATVANADDRDDQMVDRLTAATLAECGDDPECLEQASREFGDLAERAGEGAKRTEEVLEDARRILDGGE